MTTRLATILRYALGVVAVLIAVTTGRAATPSFDSFDTNDFRVVKTTAPWKILSNTANTTNNFTNVVINYINSTIINTNTIITNVNSTIVNTNTTIINQGDTIINTNVTQTFSFTTNIIDNSLTIFTNVLEITTNSITIYTNTYVTNATIFINGTNVAAINPTIGRLPYKSGTNTFDDSSMYFIDTNTTGTATLEVTDLANGGVVVSLLTGVVTNIVNGTGALTNDGAGNLGWSTIQGADLWTNNAGVLEPVDLTLPLMITNQIRFGPGSTNVLFRDGNNLVLSNTASSGNGGLEVATIDGTRALYSSGGNLAIVKGVSGVQIEDAFSGGNALRWNSNRLWPLQQGAILGGDNNTGPETPFGIINTHTNIIWGYLSGTNYSRLVESHTGTNGVGVGILYDSQASGSGGTPRDITWTNAPTYNFWGSSINLNGIPVGIVDRSQQFLPVGGFAMTLYTNIVMTNLAAGTHTLFTVPANLRAYGVSGLFYNSTNTTTIGVVARIYDGTYYRTTSYPLGNATTNNPVFYGAAGLTRVFEPGDVVTFTNTVDGISANASFKLFSTNETFKAARLFGLTNAPLKVYEVPAGKRAIPMYPISTSIAGGNIDVINDSGSQRVYKIYIVPSGGSAVQGYLAYTATVSNNAVLEKTIPILFEGDSVWVESDSGTEPQSAYFQVYEQ